MTTILDLVLLKDRTKERKSESALGLIIGLVNRLNKRDLDDAYEYVKAVKQCAEDKEGLEGAQSEYEWKKQAYAKLGRAYGYLLTHELALVLVEGVSERAMLEYALAERGLQ